MTAEPLLERDLFTVDEYERMGEAGIFEGHHPVELLDGEIVKMSTIGLRHVAVTTRMHDLMLPRCGQQALIMVASPLMLPPRSEPEPDLMVVRRRDDYYVSARPTGHDAYLVIEVSDSSIGKDRLVKVPIYARQGVAEVWIVDIQDDRVIVHTEPKGNDFRRIRTAHRGEELRPTLLPSVAITVDEILGEPA